MNECHKIKELHHTGQQYRLETLWHTNMPATLTASVLGFVKRVQATTTTANSSISSLPFTSCARANQQAVCIELLWRTTGSLPLDCNSVKLNTIFLRIDDLKCACYIPCLTLTLLTWTIWRAPTNASKWRMGFNSAFKGLTMPWQKKTTL